MSAPHDQFTKLERPAGHIEHCPCCGSDVELWQFQRAEGGPATKAICCANGEAFGPQTGMDMGGCPLYMPNDDHYKATIREAVKYWNDYAVALQGIQRAWRRHRAKALRKNP